MKRIAFAFFTLTMLTGACIGQQTSAATTVSAGTETKSKPKVFRATKDQIKEVQTKLKAAKLYSGEVTGKLDDATRASIKSWQTANGLNGTATLNRATLEKMGIALTDSQKLIPVSESSYASTSTEKKDSTAKSSTPAKPKTTIFRATKEQITAAQGKLKAGNMYSGEAHGKLDDATRAGLKKYQETNGLKVTGTLNQVTLEKMGIELTEKQRASSAAASPTK